MHLSIHAMSIKLLMNLYKLHQSKNTIFHVDTDCINITEICLLHKQRILNDNVVSGLGQKKSSYAIKNQDRPCMYLICISFYFLLQVRNFRRGCWAHSAFWVNYQIVALNSQIRITRTSFHQKRDYAFWVTQVVEKLPKYDHFKSWENAMTASWSWSKSKISVKVNCHVKSKIQNLTKSKVKNQTSIFLGPWKKNTQSKIAKSPRCP